METIAETDLPNRLFRGKVRDTYDLGEGLLLMVATDRISAFDVVLPTSIPSSSDDVQISVQMSPVRYPSSASIRTSRESEPWCTAIGAADCHMRQRTPSASTVSRVLTKSRVGLPLAASEQ